MKPFRTVTLANGLLLEMHDRGNRYFGDYHRIKIEIRCIIPLAAGFFGGDEQHPVLLRARQRFGESVVFERSLERMGVAGDEVETLRDEMVNGFLSSSRAYLEHPEFVSRFIARRLQEPGRTVVTLPR